MSASRKAAANRFWVEGQALKSCIRSGRTGPSALRGVGEAGGRGRGVVVVGGRPVDTHPPMSIARRRETLFFQLWLRYSILCMQLRAGLPYGRLTDCCSFWGVRPPTVVLFLRERESLRWLEMHSRQSDLNHHRLCLGRCL